jgi:glycosyltransferase involved in cell wall biosynthesis
MKIDPLVTIGVASYNNGKFINETLESITSQTYKNIEIIINDDSSSDNSVEIIKSWIKSNMHLNVKLLISDVNLGLCKSLNNIINVANGDYICFIGSDDMYLSKFIEKRVQFLKSTEDSIGLCYSRTNIIYENREKGREEKRNKYPSGYIFDEITAGNTSFCKPFTCMIKKSVYSKVGLYDEALMFEDLDWFFRVAREFRIEYFDSIDTVYRVLESSLGKKIFTTTEGFLSQQKIIEKNLGFSGVANNNLKYRWRYLVLSSYKINSQVAQQIAQKRIMSYHIVYYINSKF